MTAALRFILMTGKQPNVRVPGWVAAQQDIVSDADYAAVRHDLQATVQAELVAEAAPFKFQPWVTSGTTPTGKGVGAWVAKFYARHRY